VSSWLDQQNSSGAILALAAGDTLWHKTQRMRGIQFAAIVLLPMVAAATAVFIPSLQSFCAYFGFVMTVADLFLDRSIINTRQDAAQMQDRFDSIALSIPRAPLRAQDDPDIARVGELACSQPKMRTTRNEDWYTPLLGELPISFGRLACMRESVHWDQSLRSMWALLTLLAPIILGVSLIAWAILAHKSADVFFLSVVAPLTPALLWSIREWMAQRASIKTYASLQRKLRTIWTRAIEERVSDEILERFALDISWQLTAYRAATSPVPHVLYRLQRERETVSAAEAARNLKAEFMSSKATDAT
jgi:hypothetical protein